MGERKSWPFDGGPFDGLSFMRPRELGIPSVYAVPICAASYTSMGGGVLNANNPKHRELMLASPESAAEYHFQMSERGGRYVFRRIVPIVVQPSDEDKRQ
jgi:hypothetical protein